MALVRLCERVAGSDGSGARRCALIHRTYTWSVECESEAELSDVWTGELRV